MIDGFNEGVMNQYRANTIRSRFGYGQINMKGYRSQVYESPWEHWMEGGDELLSRIRKIPEVTDTFPRVEFFSLLTNGSITLSGRGQGIDGAAESRFFTTLNIIEGETLSHQEEGILLGQGLAKSLKAKPGDRITVISNTTRGSLNAIDLLVTGVFHTGAKEFDDVVFRIPIKQAFNLLDTTKIESIALGLRNLNSWKTVAADVEKNFPEFEATSFAVLDEVYYQHAVDWLAAQFRVILSIILIVVVLGILNSVSTGILDRKREIGTLRANGESIWDILKLLALEGVVLGALSSVVGILATFILNRTLLAQGFLMPPSPGITRQFYVQLELQPSMAALSLGLGILCALVGTFSASLKVVRMPISEALRSV
jgi:putative ABC transport system permease protein